MKIGIERVRTMPTVLEPGVLYVSDEYGTAAHLCACGCGSKIRTPLGPTEWSVQDMPEGPTLYPSVGNWQKPCRSHYFIMDGDIRWAGEMSEEKILAGRAAEQRRREDYYDRLYPSGFWARLWKRLKRLL
jgi:hypothetical protein